MSAFYSLNGGKFHVTSPLCSLHWRAYFLLPNLKSNQFYCFIMEKHLLQLAATEVRLVYKTKVKASDRVQLNNSVETYRFLLQTWDKSKLELQEQFKVILMNNKNHVLGLYELSTGGVASTSADTKLIFMAALKANASTIIVAHNHPSGDPQPSLADKNLTKKIKEAGRLLDITVHDHMVVTRHFYYSFADKGMM